MDTLDSCFGRCCPVDLGAEKGARWCAVFVAFGLSVLLFAPLAARTQSLKSIAFCSVPWSAVVYGVSSSLLGYFLEDCGILKVRYDLECLIGGFFLFTVMGVAIMSILCLILLVHALTSRLFVK
jgi:cellulose synthase/poly-beta-1,6-N-acetylglucosamine synthase-like glycosyltransferase